MKKITFILVFLLTFVGGSYAQCITTSPFGSAVSNNLGLPQTISTCNYTSEYSDVTGLLVGSNYVFTCNLGTTTGTPKYVTVTDVTNTVIAFGASPLTVTAITADAVRVHYSNDAACTSTSSCHVTTVQLILTCPIPTALAVSSITTTNATFTWTAGGSETAWEVLVLPSGSPAPLATDSGTAVLLPTYTETTLSSANFYQFYVRANCGSEFSPWSSALSFASACDTVTDFSENFDAAVAFPACWSKVGTGGSANIQASTSAPSAPNVMYLYGSSATSQGLVMMPLVSNAGDGSHQLRFKARGNFSTGGVIEVGYLTDSANAASFVSLQSFATSSTTVYDNFVAVLGTAPGTNQALAFRHLGTPANSVLIDDVSWETVPSIVPDCASNIISTPDAACGNFATSITWDAVADATGYKLTMGTTSGASDILNNITVNATNYSYVGNFNSTYYYKITPFNGAGNATGCTEETFTTFSSGCYCTSLPTSNDASGITNVQLGTTDFPTTDVTYVDNTTTSIDLAQGVNTNLQVTFATGYTYDTNVWIDFNDNFIFDSNELVKSVIATVNTNPNTLDASFIMPVTATLGQHRMRLGTADSGQNPPNACFSGSYGVTIDFMVNIVPAPSCLAPMTLVASAVTSSTATVSWTASTSTPANGYEYYVSTSNTAPLAGDPATGSVLAGITSANLTSLTPATTHYVWVRSLCSVTDSSDWSVAVSFTTECVALTTLPWTENFDTLTAGTNVFPTCWAYTNTSNSWSISTFPTAYSGANSLRRTWSTDGWAYTPLATLTAGTSYTFSYYMKTNDTTVGYDLTIGVGNGQSAAAMTTTLSTTTGYQNPTWTKFTFEYTPTTSGDYSFGVHVVAPSAPNGINFDDFMLELSPTTVPSCATNIVATPNATCGNFATTITWDAVAGSTGYNLTIGTTTGASDILNNVNIGANTTYSFVGNIATTYYFTLTPFNGVGTATGCTETSFVTAATGCYCPSVPTSNDGSGITNIQLDTVDYPIADVTYVDNTATVVDLIQGVNTNLQISFATGYTYDTNVWIDFDNNLTFDSSEIVYTGASLSTNPTILDASFLMPTTATLGQHTIRIGTADSGQVPPNPCFSGSYGVTVDYKVNVIVAPTCEAPMFLVSSNISITTATVSWTASTSIPANGYEYFVSTTNTAPGANTIATGTVGAGITMIDLGNLSPATAYYVWIRSLCGATLSSSWSVSTTFTTLVAPTPPTNDDCSGAIVLTPAGDFTTAVQTGTLFAATASNFIPTCQTSVSSDVWYTVVVPSSGNITIETQNAATNSMTNSVIVAFTGACNQFTQVGCNDDNGTSSMSLLSLTAQTPGATLYIGVWNNGSTTNATNSDYKIAAYDASLANDTFNNNSFSFYPNPIKDILNLSYSKNITNVAVYNLLGQQVIVKTVNENQSQIDMSNLSDGTYMVKITADNQVKTIKVMKQ